MTNPQSIQDQIHELKNKIYLIEWDLHNIKNKDVKERREKELDSSKNKLKELIAKSSSEDKDKQKTQTHKIYSMISDS